MQLLQQKKHNHSDGDIVFSDGCIVGPSDFFFSSESVMLLFHTPLFSDVIYQPVLHVLSKVKYSYNMKISQTRPHLN